MKNFILESNAAKNIDYTEIYFEQKLHRIKFATKKSVNAYLYGLEVGTPKIFSPFNVL